MENFEVPAKIGSMEVYNVTPVRGGDTVLFACDDVTFLFDSGYGFSSGRLYENIRNVLGERPLDYVLLTHSHYDHALGSAYLRKMYPGVKVVAHTHAAKVVEKEGARATMMRLDNAAAEVLGFEERFEDISWLHVDLPVEDGDVLMLGSHACQIVSLPGHTRDCIGYYFEESRMMLNTETTGTYSGEHTVMPAFLVGYQMSLDSIQRLREFTMDWMFIPHWGVLQKDAITQFLDDSYCSHVEAKDLILSTYLAGKSPEEMVQAFKDRFFSPEVAKVYPPAAFLENISIQMPQVIKECLMEQKQ